MLQALRACFDRRVLAVLALVGLAVWIFAPQLAAAALPILIAVACPLSMAVMAISMRGNGSATRARPGRPSEIRTELETISARQQRLLAELQSLEQGAPYIDAAARAEGAPVSNTVPQRM